MVNDNIWICSGGSIDTLSCPTIDGLSGQGNLVVENDVFAEGYRRASCPVGMIEVPPSPQDGMDGFCVDKYEAKSDSSNAVSEAAGSPWVSITQYDAREECIRAGKHLITEQEWLAIAHNVEDVGWNWDGGVAGTNQMSDGHSDDDGSGALVADITGDPDDNPCVNTGQSCDTSTWSTQRRTYKLSNDEYIWDLGGNVWEWVDQATYAAYPVANNWAAWTVCSTSGDGICGNTRTTNDNVMEGTLPLLRAFRRSGTLELWDEFWCFHVASELCAFCCEHEPWVSLRPVASGSTSRRLGEPRRTLVFNLKYVLCLPFAKPKRQKVLYRSNLRYRKRLNEHNNGIVKSTKYRRPLILIYFEACLKPAGCFEKREIF